MKNLLTNVMIINFHVLSPRMENRIGRKCNCTDIITPNDKNIREKNLKLFKQNA